MEPDQPRLGASVMAHIYRCDRNQTSPGTLQPAEPTRLLAISSQPKPTHRPKADKVLCFRTPLAQRPLAHNKPLLAQTPIPDAATLDRCSLPLHWHACAHRGEVRLQKGLS